MGEFFAALLQGIFGVSNQESAEQSQKELLEQQYKYDLDKMNHQAQLNQQYTDLNWKLYQSPTAQRENLKKAGLNENLAYTAVSSGSGTAIPTPQAPGKSNQNLSNQIQSRPALMANAVSSAANLYYDIGLKKAQIDNIQEQTKLTNLQGLEKTITNKYLDKREKTALASMYLTNDSMALQNEMARYQNEIQSIYNKQVRLFNDDDLKEMAKNRYLPTNTQYRWDLKKINKQFENQKTFFDEYTKPLEIMKMSKDPMTLFGTYLKSILDGLGYSPDEVGKKIKKAKDNEEKSWWQFW